MGVDDEQSRKLEAISTKTKAQQPKEPRALTRAHRAMGTIRHHFKVRLKLANCKIENKFNHGFLGRTKKFQVATHLSSQTSDLAPRTLLDKFIGVGGTVGRL